MSDDHHHTNTEPPNYVPRGFVRLGDYVVCIAHIATVYEAHRRLHGAPTSAPQVHCTVVAMVNGTEWLVWNRPMTEVLMQIREAQEQ